MTTSVWTNQRGEYDFPPLPDGAYRVWAQAVGFTRTTAEPTLAGGRTVQQDFTLPPYAELWRQFDDVEWYESLPDDTPEDRGMKGRMKRVIHHNCSTQCHNTAYVMSKRYTAADWELVWERMSRWSGFRADPPYDGADITTRARAAEYEDDIPGGGKFATRMVDPEGKPMGAQRRILEFYKKDLIGYLTRVRGPEPYPLKWRPLPRPSGEATNIVVTEYDVPEGGTSIGWIRVQGGSRNSLSTGITQPRAWTIRRSISMSIETAATGRAAAGISSRSRDSTTSGLAGMAMCTCRLASAAIWIRKATSGSPVAGASSST